MGRGMTEITLELVTILSPSTLSVEAGTRTEMRLPNRRVVIPCAGFAIVSFLVIASTMISAVRSHLQSKILPYLKAPFASAPTTTTPAPPPDLSTGLLFNMSALSNFLSNNKQAFLADVSSNQGEGWTIVMGNEAGDLDSCASAIAHSYLSTTLDRTRTIALIQTPRADFALRAENLLAYRLAHLDSQHNDLLTIDDIPSSVPLTSLRTSFALVDHNRILPKFLADPTSSNELDRVTAIFDHHDDEGFHKNANPRIIRVPTGSCASIVADYFRPRFPSSDAIPEVSSLLLSAIAVDTGGLKEGGKAEPLDRSVSQFLYPLTTFAAVSTSSNSSNEPKTIADLTEQLVTSKQAVSHLSARDLLRRDYKEYEFGSAAAGNFTRVGLSTVPMGLNKWIERDGAKKFWEAQDAWVKERDLTVSGVLTTFRTQKKQKHKREMLLIFPNSGEGVADAPSGLELKLYTEIEANKELDVERKELAGIEGRRARAWEQLNKHATRKTVAPALRAIIEGK